MRVSIDAVLESGAVCETGDLLYWETYLIARGRNIPLKYYVSLAKQLEKLGDIFWLLKIWPDCASHTLLTS